MEKLLAEPGENSIAPDLARKSVTDKPGAALTRRKEIVAVVNGCIRLTKNRKFSTKMIKQLEKKFDLSPLDAETLLCEAVLWVLSVADPESTSNVSLFLFSYWLV